MYTTARARQTEQTLSRKHKLPGQTFQPTTTDAIFLLPGVRKTPPVRYGLSQWEIASIDAAKRRHISTSANAEGPFGDNVDLTFDNCSVYFCAYAFVSLSSVLWYGNPSFPTLSRCPWSKSIPNRSFSQNYAVVTTTIRLRFDGRSTRDRLLIKDH